MEKHILNEKILFSVPFFSYFTILLIRFNLNFSINGAEYEYFFYEVLINFLIYSVIQLIFYFISSKFIKNKMIIAISSLIFPLILINPIITIVSISLLFLSDNRNNTISIFIEVLGSIVAIAFFIVFSYNAIKAIINGISYLKREKKYTEKISFKIDSSKKKPNIYWFHMDGMPSIDFIDKYYNNSLTDFQNKLDEMGFIDNKDSSFVGGNHTITALNALLNPDYYDKFLNEYLKENEECILKKCKTKYLPKYKDLIYRRLDNELFTSMKQSGYTTVAITEFNQYTSLKADYVYDVSNYNGKCSIPYFSKKYSNDEIYKNILKLHFKYSSSSIFYNNKIDNTDLIQKNIKCSYDLKDYPNINNGEFIPNKMIINALNDAKNKDNNSKIYFIDNVLMHLYWNYDSDGKLIRIKNIDLNDYDDCYEYATKVILEFIKYIRENDENSIIIIQGDHGIHAIDSDTLKKYFNINEKDVLDIRKSTVSAILIPEDYKNGDEKYLNNPLNITRYLINNFVGNNYEYIE